jgi:hypothetical protein
MNLRALALKHLETMAKPVLSRRDSPKSVPAGQAGSIPYSSRHFVVPVAWDSGTTKDEPIAVLGQIVSLGQCESAGTGGTTGTLGTIGTSSSPTYSMVALKREADRRNTQAARNDLTDRWCACGRLARLAWPEDNRREVWRCDDCAPAMGRA